MRAGLTAIICIALSTAAQAAGSCTTQAMDQNGKKLTGSAYSMYMAKCSKLAANTCDASAVDKNGMVLVGKAKNAYIATCLKQSIGK
jgi:hypothetical protein